MKFLYIVNTEINYLLHRNYETDLLKVAEYLLIIKNVVYHHHILPIQSSVRYFITNYTNKNLEITCYNIFPKFIDSFTDNIYAIAT